MCALGDALVLATGEADVRGSPFVEAPPSSVSDGGVSGRCIDEEDVEATGGRLEVETCVFVMASTAAHRTQTSWFVYR